MTDRRDRFLLTVIGLILLGGGGLAVCLGAGVFGTDRANRRVFDATVIRWWNEGGWMSFATVVAIGVVGALLGAWIMLAQLRRNDGRTRTPSFAYPPTGEHGETALRAAALSHTVERDLEQVPDISKALVGLFGRYPHIELRAVIDVYDDADFDTLPTRVASVLSRLEKTTTVWPDPVQITVRFDRSTRARQLV